MITRKDVDEYLKQHDLVAVDMQEYESLLDDSSKLSALEGAGVDNWDGYEYAMEMWEDNSEQ